MKRVTLHIQAEAYAGRKGPVETTLGQISALGAALSAVAEDMREAELTAEKTLGYHGPNAPIIETGLMAASVTMTVGAFIFTIRVEEPVTP